MAVARFWAKFISVVLHPLLVPTYMVGLLALVNPYLFGTNYLIGLVVGQVFYLTFLIPSIAIVLMKMLNMISSFQMPDKQERIGPLIVAGVLFLWTFWNLKNASEIPLPCTIFLLGSTIALFVGFFINLFFKISLHAIGMGGFIAMVFIIMIPDFHYSYGSFVVEIPTLGAFKIMVKHVLMAVIVLAGLTGTARLILGAHTSLELYTGYFIGLWSMFIALVAML